jgi:hypothetical protein
MVDGTATLVTMAGAIVLLYVLIKAHLYVTRKYWRPVIEEEVAAERDGRSDADEASGSGDGTPEEERPPRGWDEVG